MLPSALSCAASVRLPHRIFISLRFYGTIFHFVAYLYSSLHRIQLNPSQEEKIQEVDSDYSGLRPSLWQTSGCEHTDAGGRTWLEAGPFFSLDRTVWSWAQALPWYVWLLSRCERTLGSPAAGCVNQQCLPASLGAEAGFPMTLYLVQFCHM